MTLLDMYYDFSPLIFYFPIVRCMYRIMVIQTIPLSDNGKLSNRGYVDLTHNLELIMKFLSKSSNKIICVKLYLFSKILGLI